MYDSVGLLESVPPQDRIAAARELVESVIAADPAECVGAELDGRLVELAALGERVDAAAMLTTAVWEQRGTWMGSARSPKAWLVGEAGLGERAAGRQVRGGRLVARHEVVAKRLRVGELSCSKVDLLAVAAARGREQVFTRDVDVLVERACDLSVDATARLAGRWRALADDELADAELVEQRARRCLHHSRVGNQYRTDGSCDLESGAIVDAALRAAMGAPDAAGVPGGPRRIPQQRADALVDICRSYLQVRNGGHGNEPVAVVNVHVDERTLVGSSADGFDPDAVCDLVPGGPVPRSVVRGLLADSWVGAIVFGARREVIDHGRLRRLFTPAQVRALIARDGGRCVVPGCEAGVEQCRAHHLRPFEAGGATDLTNGAMVCGYHHRRIHDHGDTLTRGPTGWTLTPRARGPGP